jgi:prepilin-type N-terminal cleavage/methylation domain-containing protein
MRRAGFSLLEMLLVIGIVGAMTGLATPMYRDYQIRNDLSIATEQVTQGLARARLLSQAGQDNDAWGFYAPAGIMYKGASYQTRDASYDETYAMPSTITFTGLPEVSYSKLDGAPSGTGAITLTAINDDTRNVLISIEQETIAVVENDFVTVCHHPGQSENPHSLNINENAWPAHQSHGDTLGPCPGDLVASSSSSSSNAASSAAASSAASSAAATCVDRFSVAADGTITTTGTVNVTYKVLGSDITYGEGGPEVNVYVSRKKLTGSTYQSLFSGADVDGGETETVSGFTNGSQVIVKVRGYYKKKGWLTFDQTFATNDGTGHIEILRDGDPLPDYPAFDDQNELHSYLQAILDAQGRIDVGTYDLVLLTELGNLSGSSADFQDAVLLLQFSQPSC